MRSKVCMIMATIFMASVACSTISTKIPIGQNISPGYNGNLSNNPWMLTATQCMAPDFGDLNFEPNSAFSKNSSKYFEDMWKEANLTSKIASISPNSGADGFPLTGNDVDFGPPCAWSTISTDNPIQYYFLFRSKDGALQKYILRNDVVAQVMVGNWEYKAPYESPVMYLKATVKTNCDGKDFCLYLSDGQKGIGPLPLFDANSRTACFGKQEDYICLAFNRTDRLQLIGSGETVSPLIYDYAYPLSPTSK